MSSKNVLPNRHCYKHPRIRWFPNILPRECDGCEKARKEQEAAGVASHVDNELSSSHTGALDESNVDEGSGIADEDALVTLDYKLQSPTEMANSQDDNQGAPAASASASTTTQPPGPNVQFDNEDCGMVNDFDPPLVTAPASPTPQSLGKATVESTIEVDGTTSSDAAPASSNNDVNDEQVKRTKEKLWNLYWPWRR